MSLSTSHRRVFVGALMLFLLMGIWWWASRENTAAAGVSALSQWAPSEGTVTINGLPMRMAFAGDQTMAEEQVFAPGTPIEVEGEFAVQDELLPEYRLSLKKRHSQLGLGVFVFEAYRPGEKRITRYAGTFMFEFNSTTRRLTCSSVGESPSEPGTYLFKVLLQRPGLGSPDRELIVFFQTFVRITPAD